uniref:NADH dehydrogenase subunit 3 n=1 Tax=Oxyethira ecornuta TaxID=1401674 RepID=UPI0022DCDEA9|nr:NADH dehydrogenase subunit 3 [Oxyethira ecornuta]UZZ44240.1 NADH dehydrogenase subunit 3 [Oxyethira ecornuta]
MITMFILIASTMALSSIVMTISSILSKKMNLCQNKLTPFECGFSPNSTHRIPFFIHFFLIALIFLIFDIEIILLLPMILILNMNNSILWMIMFSYFIFLLLLSIIHEWNQMLINWTK